MPERAELKTKWLFLTSCLIQRSLWFTKDTTHVLTLFQLKVLGEQELELWLQETTLETFLGALVSSRVDYGYSACDGFSSMVSVRLSLWIISEGGGSYQEYGPGRYSCQNIWRYLQFLVSLKAGNEKEMKERIGQKRGAVWYLTRSFLKLLIYVSLSGALLNFNQMLIIGRFILVRILAYKCNMTEAHIHINSGVIRSLSLSIRCSYFK